MSTHHLWNMLRKKWEFKYKAERKKIISSQVKCLWVGFFLKEIAVNGAHMALQMPLQDQPETFCRFQCHRKRCSSLQVKLFSRPGVSNAQVRHTLAMPFSKGGEKL